MAEIYTKSTSCERKLDANKRAHFKLIGHEGNPVIEMTSYKFSNGSKVKESYYLAAQENGSGTTERDEFFETQEEIHSARPLKHNEKAANGETSAAESTSSVADKEGISQLSRDNLSKKSSPEHEATKDSKRPAKEKETAIIRDKKINILKDVSDSRQKLSYNKPSPSPVDNAQHVCASTVRAKESKENGEREFRSTETIAGTCPIHDYPNTAYCLTCSVMVCEECLITVHKDTSSESQCEISSIYQMIDKFIIECNEYADEDIELTKDLKLNMTGITLYLHREGNAISEKMANLKEELKRLEESLEKNTVMKSNVKKNEDHLTEWIIAIQFYKRTYSNLHASSTSASDMKEIVKNRDRIQDQLGEYSLFVEKFKQKHPNFSFDILHLKDFDTQDQRQCDNTNDIVIILNDDDKPEFDIKQPFSKLLDSHDSSHSSLNICVAVEPDEQNASKNTAGELFKNKHGKSFTQILGFFPDMSATSTPLPETFERVSKETASEETACFFNTTDSQKSEDVIGYTDTNQIILSYKQEKSTVYGFDNNSKNETEIQNPSKLLADTLAHIPNPSLAESFQELAINVPVDIKPESEETEIILNTVEHLTLTSNLSDQKVMQSSQKDSKPKASKTNRNDNSTGSNSILDPKTIPKKSKRKKKHKNKSHSKSTMKGSDPKQIPETSVVQTQDAKTKKSKPLRTNQSLSISEKQDGKKLVPDNKDEISAAGPTNNKFASNSLSENSKSKRKTNAEADSQMSDYFFRPVLEPHCTVPRAKLDGVQNQPSPSDLDLKDLDLTEDYAFEEQPGKRQFLQQYIASPSKYVLPTSSKMSDMKEPRTLQDSIIATGGNLQQATATASKSVNSAPASGKKSKSKSKSKRKTDDNIDLLGKIMEKCLDITSHQPDIPESTHHKLDDSVQNPSQSSHSGSHERLYNTRTMDTQHISKKEGAVPKRSPSTGKGIRTEKILCSAVLEDSKDNDYPKTRTSSLISYESDSLGLLPTPFLNPESTRLNAFTSVQDLVTCSMKSIKNNSSSKPRVITGGPGSYFMKTFLLDCLTEAMSKTKGYFKYKEEIHSLEKEWLIQGSFHEKTESLEDDQLSDLKDSSQSQSPLSQISCLPKDKESMAPGSSKSSTKEHLKEIALQISRVLNVDSAEVSKNCITYVVPSDTLKASDNRVSEYIIETLPENQVRRFLSGEIIDEENYQVFKKSIMQVVKHAQKQAQGIAKAGSLDHSSIPHITQALITIASKKSNEHAGTSRRAASTSRLSIPTVAAERRKRRVKRQSNRQKMRQEAMKKTCKAD